MFLSGKLTEFLVKKYFFPQVDELAEIRKLDNSDLTIQEKKRMILSQMGTKDFQEAQRLLPKDLRNNYYFGKGRNFFIQLIDDT